MRRNMLEGDDFPVTPRDMLMQFLMHGNKELSAVWCLKGIGESHGVRVRRDEREHMRAEEGHRMRFRIVSSKWLKE